MPRVTTNVTCSITQQVISVPHTSCTGDRAARRDFTHMGADIGTCLLKVGSILYETVRLEISETNVIFQIRAKSAL